MKRSILTFLVATVASIGISQLASNYNVNTNTKIEESLNLNKYEDSIAKLNQEYANGGWIGIIVIVPGVDWGRN